MYTRAIPYAVAAFLTGVLNRIGGFKEIREFTGYRDVSLVGGIILNILLVLIFSEIYLTMDKLGDGKHFGGLDQIDSIYFSFITGSTTGYGDTLPKTKAAKMVVMTHVTLQMFVLVPMIIESFKPGN